MATEQDTKSPLEPNSTTERIVTAAYACFEKHGVRKTSIEDIAVKSGVSRQTIYKYFSGKPALIEAIALREMVQVGHEIRKRVRHDGSFGDRLSDALAISVELGRKNSYVRMVIDDPTLLPQSLGPGGGLYYLQVEQWNHFLASGRRSGELADDLDDEEIVRWLSLCQFMMHVSLGRLTELETDLHVFIRRFIVEPVLSRRGNDGARDSGLASLVDEVRGLRAIIDAQTELLARLAPQKRERA